MSKITKKSVNEVMKLYSENIGNDVVCNLTNNAGEVVMEIHVKNSLTIPERGLFVDRVVNSCFDVDGDFMPQYLDPIFMITLLQMTTDIPPFEDSIPVVDENGNPTGDKTNIINIEKTYELCRAVNLRKAVADEVYQNLISELVKMVEDKLGYMKEMNIHKCTGLASTLSSAFAQVQEMKDFKLTANDELKESLDKISTNFDKPKLEVLK